MAPSSEEPPRGRWTAAQVLAAIVLSGLLATWLTRPLLWRPGSLPRYAGPTAAMDNADRNLNVWILAWTARAAAEDPRHLFDGNIYFPARNTLAGSETMLAHLPFTVPVWLATRDSTWVLKAELAWGIAGTALFTLLLARFHGLLPWAAALVVAAVALEPGRINPLGTGDGIAAQPQYLGFQYAPLALFALGVWATDRRRRGAIGLAFALAAQALACFYLGYFAFLTVPLYAVGLLWARRPGTGDLRRDATALGLAVAAGALLVVPVAAQYLAARSTGAVRPPDPELAHLGSLAGAGPAVALARVGPVAALLAIAALVALAVRRERQPRFVRAGWWMAIGALVIALGPEWRVGEWRIPLPYRFLAAVIPGFGILRGPLRALPFAVLGLGLAGAWAVQRAARGLRPPLQIALGVLGFVLAMLWVSPTRTPWEPAPLRADLPPVYAWLRDQPRDGGVLEIPGALAEEDLAGLHRESKFMLYSTVHWQPLVNGYTAYPPVWGQLAKSLAARLPDRDALQTLVNLAPVRRVIVHFDKLLPGQKRRWEETAAASGLAETIRLGGAVVYAVDLLPDRDWRGAVDAPPGGRTLEGTATSPLAAGCRRGRVSATLPSQVRVGLGALEVPVRVTNDGDCRWPGLAVRPEGLVLVTAEWVGAPADAVAPVMRARLPHDLGPGESADLAAIFAPPRVPGVYTMRIVVAQEGASEPIATFEGPVRVDPPRPRTA